MKYILTYLPVSLVHSNKPRVFESEYDARMHLIERVCGDCTKHVRNKHDIHCWLDSCCGLEFDYEEIE